MAINYSVLALPGLVHAFNVYLEAIDSIIPNSTRNVAGTVDILNRAQSVPSVMHDDAIRSVNGFISACEHLRKQQFCLDVGKRYTDLESCWLSILLLGNEWDKAVRYLLDLELPAVLTCAKEIRLRPIVQKDSPSFIISLATKFSGIGEAEYLFFEQHIKSRFSLISTYNLDGKEITIRNRNICDAGEGPDSDGLLNGKVPLWLKRLLEWGVVEEITINYPIQKRKIDTASSVIGSLVAWPNCPVEWRVNNSVVLDEAFKKAQHLLEVGNGPFYTILTQGTEEWLPFLYHYASKVAGEVKLLADQRILGAENEFVSPATQSDVVSLVDYSLARRLSLVSTKIERIESEYEKPPYLFSRVSDGTAEILITKETFLIEVSPNMGGTILCRIGMVEYLDAVIACLLDHEQKVQETIRALDQSDKCDPPLIELNGIQRLSIGTSEEFCCATLTLVRQHIVAIRRLYKNVSVHLRQNVPWSWLLESPIDPLPEHEVFRHFLKLAIRSENVTTRIRALASILYVLNPSDAVTDTEPVGLCDDNYAMAMILRELPAQEISDQFRNWAITVCGNADGYMENSLQENIMSMLTHYIEQIEKYS